jgi:hypothetical protein
MMDDDAKSSHRPQHARAPTTHDSTRYGKWHLAVLPPRTFLAHHRAAISAAVVLADATTILLPYSQLPYSP